MGKGIDHKAACISTSADQTEKVLHAMEAYRGAPRQQLLLRQAETLTSRILKPGDTTGPMVSIFDANLEEARQKLAILLKLEQDLELACAGASAATRRPIYAAVSRARSSADGIVQYLEAPVQAAAAVKGTDFRDSQRLTEQRIEFDSAMGALRTVIQGAITQAPSPELSGWLRMIKIVHGR